MITPEDVRRRLDEWQAKRKSVLQKIEQAARATIPVLKDAGRSHSAAELDALFFELDAVDQEAETLVHENIDAALEALRQRIRR